jgi:hypothetical protein
MSEYSIDITECQQDMSLLRVSENAVENIRFYGSSIIFANQLD